MSENKSEETATTTTTGGPAQAVYETQQQRWVKYGANVALVAAIVVVLAVLVTWIAQRYSGRIDTTAAGTYSLKPQTLNVIKANEKPVKLISLYAPLSDKDRQKAGSEEASEKAELDAPRRVADLLEEYERKGKNISFETIDPDDAKRVDALYDEVTAKYGGAIASYKKFLDEFKAGLEKINKMVADEAARSAALPVDKLGRDELGRNLSSVFDTVAAIPEELTEIKGEVEKRAAEKRPNYKTIADSSAAVMERIASNAQAIAEFSASVKDPSKLPPAAQKAVGAVPAEIKAYLAESIPRYEAIAKEAKAIANKGNNLQELKVDELQRALRTERDPILVLGPEEYKVIPYSQVWQVNSDVRYYTQDGKVRPHFAGEQQVTSAVLQLTNAKKPKVCFVRSGGQAVTNPGMPPFLPGGPLSEVANRLRDHNFEVLEKDISGMSQMRQQQPGQSPEPSDEQIKDAVWIVLDIPSMFTDPRMGMPPSPVSIGDKLAEHLKGGGSAMVLFEPRIENPMAPSPPETLTAALKDWGVVPHADVVAVHESITVPEGSAAAADPLEDAKRRPFVWDFHNYGGHMLCGPVQNLDSIFAPLMVVGVPGAPGAKVTPLLPLADVFPGLQVWGEKNIDSIQEGKPVFEADKGDLGGALYGGAAVEKDGAGRLVVIGAPYFMHNNLVNTPDVDTLRRERRFIRKFPGNGEFAANCIYWLAKMEPLIAISPTAAEVSRIKDPGEGALKAWHALVMFGLPALAALAGVGMYFARRD